jgi:hypothetical protein
MALDYSLLNKYLPTEIRLYIYDIYEYNYYRKKYNKVLYHLLYPSTVSFPDILSGRSCVRMRKLGKVIIVQVYCYICDDWHHWCFSNKELGNGSGTFNYHKALPCAYNWCVETALKLGYIKLLSV